MRMVAEFGQAGRDGADDERGADDRAHSSRLCCNWDGLAGLRWVEVSGDEPTLDGEQADKPVEHELGTMSEPMS